MVTRYLADLGRDWYSSLRQSISDPLSRPVPLALAATTGSLGAWFLWRKLRNRNRKLPPSPRGWPIIGNLMDLSEETMHLDFMKLQKRDNLPDIFTINTGLGNKLVILNSYKVIKDAFVTQGDLFAERPEALVFHFDIINVRDEIFVKPYLDPAWQDGKTFIMSALRSVGFGSSRGSEEKILEQVELLIESLDQKVKSKEPVDISKIMTTTASNVIQGLLFGKKYSLDDPELIQRTDTVKTWYAEHMNTAYFEYLSIWFIKLFLSGKIKRLLAVTNDVKKFIRDEIREHQETVNADHPRDFIDIYLTKKQGTVNIDQLVDTTLMFLPDAIHTVGCLISWVIIYVTYHPEVMRRIQKEVDDVTSGNRHVTWADRPNTPYTEAAIMEAVRISSAVTASAMHTPIRDTYYKGYFIPAGMPVVANLNAGLMDPENFTEPEVFNPDRFLNEDGSVVKTDMWIPFGLGRRRCVGEQTTKIELHLLISNLYQQYDVSFPEDEPRPTLESTGELFFRMPKPFKVVLKHRK